MTNDTWQIDIWNFQNSLLGYYKSEGYANYIWCFKRIYSNHNMEMLNVSENNKLCQAGNMYNYENIAEISWECTLLINIFLYILQMHAQVKLRCAENIC